MLTVIQAVRAAVWTQNNLGAFPLDIRDKFKNCEKPGPAIDMATGWKMFKAWCEWSKTPLQDAIVMGIEKGMFNQEPIVSYDRPDTEFIE